MTTSPAEKMSPTTGSPTATASTPPVVPLAVAPPLPGADVPGADPLFESPDPGDDGPVDGELVDGEPGTADPVPRVDGVVVVPAESDAPLPGAVLCPGRPLPVVDALPGESVLPGPARR